MRIECFRSRLVLMFSGGSDAETISSPYPTSLNGIEDLKQKLFTFHPPAELRRERSSKGHL